MVQLHSTPLADYEQFFVVALFILLLYAVNTALVYGALMIVEGIEHSSSSYDNARGALAGITNRLADDRPSTKTIASIAGLAGFLTTCTCVPMIVYALFLKKRLAVLHEAAGALR